MNDNWMHAAACRGLDADAWFSDDPIVTSAAIAVCGSCPVRTACLAAALEADGTRPYGVWGGLTGDERRELRGEAPRKRPGLSGQERRLMLARAQTMTREGRSAREVATRLGVDQRTVERWVSKFRTAA